MKNTVWCVHTSQDSNDHVITQETHILHEFADDFYGSILSACVVGYIRNEMNFSSTGKG